MADIAKAIDFVLRQEDSALAGVCTRNPADRGGLTRYGIASRWHPELVKSGYYTDTAENALNTAREVYAAEYASFLQLRTIRSQAIANALLSFAVLENAAASALNLQRALNGMGARLVVDGSIGPLTLKTVNATAPKPLLAAIVEANRAYLQAIVTRDGTQKLWLKGWMNRCDAVARQNTEVVM